MSQPSKASAAMSQAKQLASSAAQSFTSFRDEKRKAASEMSDVDLADHISYGFMACWVLAIILMFVGFFKGFGQAQIFSKDSNKGVCCKECVQNFGTFVSIVIGVPVLIFLAIMGLMLYFYGASHVRRGQKERERRSATENSFLKAAKESMAGKYVIGAGVVLFVAISLLVFFTGPSWLAGENKAP